MGRTIAVLLLCWAMVWVSTKIVAQDAILGGITPDEATPPNYWYGHKIGPIYRQFKKNPSPLLCNRLIEALETLLAKFPDGRFAAPPYLVEKRLGVKSFYMIDDAGGPLGMLSKLYQYQGKCEEALTIEIRKALVMMEDDAMMLASGLNPFPYPFGDSPNSLRPTIEFTRQVLAKKPQIHPLIFVNGWCVRTKWKGSKTENVLISLNDFAYTIGRERWGEILRRDWKAWRFTISVKGKTISFSAGSRQVTVNGKETIFSRSAERYFYDLYVPLRDLVKVLGGTVRSPKADELTVLQRHLPVPSLVVDLN